MLAAAAAHPLTMARMDDNHLMAQPQNPQLLLCGCDWYVCVVETAEWKKMEDNC